MIFTIYPSNRVKIAGSLHYYSNNGLHNYNDYSIQEVIETIADLQNKFKINPLTARIHNIEYGFNINTPFNPRIILKNLISYKSKPFNQAQNITEGNFYFSKGSNQYFLKFYNKGVHFKRDENILRFEKKIKKMECLKNGQVYLSDIIQPAFVDLCLKDLVKSFDELIITEKVEVSLLTTSQLKTFELCNNPRNWETMTPKQRHKNKIAFTQIINDHGTQQLKSIVKDLLIKKGNDLTKVTKHQRERFDSSYIVSDHSHLDVLETTQNMHRCKTCNRNISHQNKLSVYCSEKFFGKNAKQCRNKESNPRNNFKVKIERETAKGLLFDILPFMKTYTAKLHSSA